MARFVHKLYALLTGYFWLPCPVCGRHFGGHESNGPVLMDATAAGGHLTCGAPKCADETVRRNKATALANGWWDASWGEPPDGYAPFRIFMTAGTVSLKP